METTTITPTINKEQDTSTAMLIAGIALVVVSMVMLYFFRSDEVMRIICFIFFVVGSILLGVASSKIHRKRKENYMC